MKHLGIVACSAEGAALCYRTICAEGGQRHPEVSMHTHPLAAYIDAIERRDWAAVGDLMLASAGKLAAIGAELLICPDNTIHQAMPHVLPRSPRRWLHIAAVVADAAAARGFRKVGLTGTRSLVDSAVYPEHLAARGIDFVRPDPSDREAMNRVIFEELVPGEVRGESVALFQAAIERFARAGCDAVILGCTEIPLIIGDDNSPLPTLDSTRLLARAALDAAR